MAINAWKGAYVEVVDDYGPGGSIVATAVRTGGFAASTGGDGGTVEVFRPNPPTNVEIIQDVPNASATLSWGPPTSDGGAAISGYPTDRDGVDSAGAGAVATVKAATDRSMVYTKLVSGNSYNIRVAARNSAGDSDYVTVPIVFGGSSPEPPPPSPVPTTMLRGLFRVREVGGAFTAARVGPPPAAPPPAPSNPLYLPLGSYRVGPEHVGPDPDKGSLDVRSLGDSVLFYDTPDVGAEGMDFHGRVSIRSTDQPFRDCIFRGRLPTVSEGLVATQAASQANTLFERCLFIPQYPHRLLNGLMGKSMTLRRCGFADGVDNLSITGPGVTVEGSLLRSLSYFLDPDKSDGQSHCDLIQFHPGAAGWMIRFNTLLAKFGTRGSHSADTVPSVTHTGGPTPSGASLPAIAAMMWGSSLHPDTFPGNGDVLDNFIEGGVITLNGTGPNGYNLGRIWRNRFGYDAYKGPSETAQLPLGFDATTIVDTGSGSNVNVWDVTGNPVPVRRNL